MRKSRTLSISRIRLVALVCLQSVIWLCSPVSAQVADTIYHGGPIITMNEAAPSVEAIAVKDGRIIAVGPDADVLRHQGNTTEVIDLEGRTLCPAFMDGHSHFINSLQVARQANVFAPPAGPVKNIADVIAALKEVQETFNFPPGETIMAYGYDPDTLEERRHITAADLDPHFPDNPVMVQHVSLHGAVLNSVALEKYGVTAETETPPGGVIARIEGTNEPAGLLMEAAFLPIFAALPAPTMEQSMEDLVAGQMIYAAAGITTAHEGATHLSQLEILSRGADEGRMFIDVVAYPFITELAAVIEEHPAETFGEYHNHFKLGGIKITTDGSPQGRTAYFSTPYLLGGPSGEENWRGEPLFPQETLNQMVANVYGLGLPLIVHCNGDASIDMFLEAHEQATGPSRTEDRRTAIIHSQFVRRDQLERYAEYHFVPSFYTEHCFFFGETHIANRGHEQAAFLSPMKSAYDLGLHCTNHTDFNVAPIDQLFVMWSAVNRTMRNGEVLGPDERITPWQSLKSLTLDAAWQYGEEDQKGSLEAGKLADLVILSDNPLTIEPMQINTITVVETIKEGETIYSAK